MLSFRNKDYNQTNIIAHRGASAIAYENTIEAFQLAIKMNADAIELDVRKTKDDVLVVHHDANLKKYTNCISDMLYAEIIEFNNRADYIVPTLQEVLSTCSGKIAIDIELKEVGYENLVVKTAKKYFKSEHLLFTSFQKESLEVLKKNDNCLSVGYLFQKPIKISSVPEYVDFVLPHITLCKIGYLSKLFKLGKPIIVWTVDKIETKEKLKSKEVFGIITNKP